LKVNEPILMPIDTSAQLGKGMKQSIMGVRMSKFKVTHSEDRFGALAEASFSSPFGRIRSSSGSPTILVFPYHIYRMLFVNFTSLN